MYSRLVARGGPSIDEEAKALLSRYFDVLNDSEDYQECFEAIYWDDIAFQSALLYLAWQKAFTDIMKDKTPVANYLGNAEMLDFGFSKLVQEIQNKVEDGYESDFDPYKAKDELEYLNRKIRAYRQNIKKLRINYDTESKKLSYGSKECLFAPTRRTKERMTISFMFEHPEKKVFLADIWNAMGMPDYSKKHDWRQVYGILTRINLKARADLGIDKLIEFDTMGAAINPKYL